MKDHNQTRKPGPRTRSIHTGRHPHEQFGFVNTPVYRGSTVLAPSMDALMNREDARFVYATKGTPTSEALEAAETALERVDSPSERRESVRAARRELKSARALAPLLRSREAPPSQASVDGVLEFSAKANQLLGPLRDRVVAVAVSCTSGTVCVLAGIWLLARAR